MAVLKVALTVRWLVEMTAATLVESKDKMTAALMA
jgi:hypothetical protein